MYDTYYMMYMIVYIYIYHVYIYTNLLKHGLQNVWTFPRSNAKENLGVFSKELVNLLAIGQLDSLEVGDIKPIFW